MKKTNLLFITALLILIAGSCSSLLGIKTKTDKPNSDISTKSVRYVTNRPINLNKFEVGIIDDELNLFKNNALIKIEIEGSFKKKDWENTYFDEIIFLEKVNRLNTSGFHGNCEITVSLLPKFTSKRKKKDKTVYDIQTETVSFKMALEYRLYTCGLGRNTIKINVGNQSKVIELIQKK